MNAEQAEEMEAIRKKHGMKRKTANAIANRFLDADEDGSQTLDYQEFLKLLDMVDSRLAKNLFNTIDKRENLDEKHMGKDGYVSFGEFAEEMARIDSMDDDERRKWTFGVYDKNKNGFLDLDELMQAMNDPNVGIKFSPDRLKGIFHSRACRNPNKISQPEFCIQCKKHMILEMPVKLIYTKVQAYVFDYDDEDEEFDDKAKQKHRLEYSKQQADTFEKDAEQREEAEKKRSQGGGKKKQKNVKVKTAADGTTYEDSD